MFKKYTKASKASSLLRLYLIENMLGAEKNAQSGLVYVDINSFRGGIYPLSAVLWIQPQERSVVI